jgi:receptor protein-tyrosine kinase/non-specific protein-tyrosine kinase
MSRIERALERARKLREETEGTAKKIGEEVFSQPRRETFNKGIPLETNNNPYLVTLSDPESPIAEEYKKLKSMLVKLTRKSGFQNTVMITSSVAGEGKSITAINLALSIASEYDHTVLLVDADLRNPSIHKYLGIRHEIGLSDCLSKNIDIGRALITTEIGKLTLLPAGQKVSTPVELLLSNKMKNLIKELKNRYADRYIIIDTPPILHFAEVHFISSVMDGVIFVVREGIAPLGGIKEALNMLKDANLLGVVYSCAEIGGLDSNSYYRYYTGGIKK